MTLKRYTHVHKHTHINMNVCNTVYDMKTIYLLIDALSSFIL